MKPRHDVHASETFAAILGVVAILAAFGIVILALVDAYRP